MIEKHVLIEMESKIQLIKKAAGELNRMSGDLPAVERNTSRILASLKMLEINISDFMEL